MAMLAVKSNIFIAGRAAWLPAGVPRRFAHFIVLLRLVERGLCDVALAVVRHIAHARGTSAAWRSDSERLLSLASARVAVVA
jgi:hypothetical protein